MVATGNVGVAFALVVGGGLATVIGAAVVFVLKALTPRLLAASLGFAAGVMLYVTFAEIFMRKSVNAWTDAGYSDDAAYRLSTICFFAGMVAVAILDQALHVLMQHSDAISAFFCRPFQRAARWARRKQLVPKCWCQRAVDSSTGGCKAAVADAPAAANAGSVDGSQHKALPGAERAEALGEADAKSEASSKSSDGTDVEAGCCEESSCCDCPLDGAPPSQGASQPAEAGCCDVIERAPSVLVAGTPPEGANDVMAVLESDCHTADLRRMGFLVALALGIHNLPEGIATFVGALSDVKVGAGLALAIGIHNIPEGICVSVPIYYSTRSKWKAFLWGAIPGMFEPLGGLIAYLALSGDNSLAFAIIFGMVAGVMVFISIRELIPSAYKYDPMDKVTSIAVILGMVVMAASLILFTL